MKLYTDNSRASIIYCMTVPTNYIIIFVFLLSYEGQIKQGMCFLIIQKCVIIQWGHQFIIQEVLVWCKLFFSSLSQTDD